MGAAAGRIPCSGDDLLDGCKAEAHTILGPTTGCCSTIEEDTPEWDAGMNPSIPKYLFVKCPNGHTACHGNYVLTPISYNGMPVWQKAPQRRKFIYSSRAGLWSMSGRQPDIDGEAVANLFCAQRHDGRFPPEVPRGTWYRACAGQFLPDPDVVVVQIDGLGQPIQRRHSGMVTSAVAPPPAFARADGNQTEAVNGKEIQPRKQARTSFSTTKAKLTAPLPLQGKPKDKDQVVCAEPACQEEPGVTTLEAVAEEAEPRGGDGCPSQAQAKGKAELFLSAEQVRNKAIAEWAPKTGQARRATAPKIGELVVGFRPVRGEKEEECINLVHVRFTSRPLGVKLGKRLPVPVIDVSNEAFAMGVRRGMLVVTVDGHDVARWSHEAVHTLIEEKSNKLGRRSRDMETVFAGGGSAAAAERSPQDGPRPPAPTPALATDEHSSSGAAVSAHSLDITGATGACSSAINGRFNLVEELCQGCPVWQKESDKDKWLLRFSNGYWYVAETDRKVSDKAGGFMRSSKQGQLFPHVAGPWRVWTGGAWELQEAVAISQASQGPPGCLSGLGSCNPSGTLPKTLVGRYSA